MISFLIVNYFTSDLVRKLIESINQYITKIRYEILIFDNSFNVSEWNSLLEIKQKYRFVNTFRGNENYGFVRANNELFKYTKGDILILINPDSLLIDDSIEKLIYFLYANEDIAIAGPMLLNKNGSYQESFFKFPSLFSLFKEHILLYQSHAYSYKTDKTKIQDCDVIKGACLVINKKFIQNYIFDPDFIMYSEEVDLCLRMKKEGKKVFYYPDTKIIHFGEKSSSLEIASKYSLYNYYRSKLLLFKKHYKPNIFKLAKIVLKLSLIEKTVILFLLNKKNSSKLHFFVFKEILNESKNISNM